MQKAPGTKISDDLGCAEGSAVLLGVAVSVGRATPGAGGGQLLELVRGVGHG